MKQTPINITLRKRKLPTGKTSLYIEYYVSSSVGAPNETKGKRTYETLGLYLCQETSITDIENNRLVFSMAESTLVERRTLFSTHPFEAELAKGFGITDLIAWLSKKSYTTALPYSKSSFANTLSCIRAYSSFNVLFDHIDQDFVNRFAQYLSTSKKRGRHGEMKSEESRKPATVKVYLNVLKWSLAFSAKKGFYQKPVPSFDFTHAPQPKPDKTSIVPYLTLDELKQFCKLTSSEEHIIMSFMFSCLTGISLKEVRNVIWKDLTKDETCCYMTIDTKTRGRITLPVNKSAQQYLPKRPNNVEEPIFVLPTEAIANRKLATLFEKANIKKRLSSSITRHTYVMLLLTNGAPIHLVSRLLGYKSIASMQVYASMMDYDVGNSIDIINQYINF